MLESKIQVKTKPGKIKNKNKKKSNIQKLRVTIKKLKRSLLNLESRMKDVEGRAEENQTLIHQHETNISELSSKLKTVPGDLEPDLKHFEGLDSDSANEADPTESENIEDVQTPSEIHEGNTKDCNCSTCLQNHLEEEQLQTLMPPPKETYSCSLCPREFTYQRHLSAHLQAHERKMNPGKVLAKKHYDCKKCNKSFASELSLKSHEKLHRNERAFECHICDQAFNRKDYLENHVLTHEDLRPFSCETCHNSFKRKSILQAHAKIHSADPSKRATFKCEHCDKEFMLKRSLEDHVKGHLTAEQTGNKTVKTHPCKECGKVLGSLKRLYAHSRAHKRARTAEETYCLVCKIRFSRPHSLKRHKQQKHSGNPDAEPLATPPPKILPADPENTPGKPNLRKLKREQRAEMDGAKPGGAHCEICGIEFSRKDSLRRHEGMKHPELKLKVTTPEKPKMKNWENRCKICYKTFASSSALSKHTAHQHGYICSFCRVSFRNWEQFQEHVLKRHEKQFRQSPGLDSRKSGCKICGKEMWKETLLSHVVNYHAWDKPYKCKFCSKSFSTVSTQKKHLAQHQREDRDYEPEESE